GFVTRIVNGRDPGLCGHLRRVGYMSALLAEAIGYSADDVKLISLGACLHDIGKLSISEYILYKPARLTATEFAVVSRHAELGVELLTPLELDSRISDIVLYHHENYDGSGYPRGLAGEKIPHFARIVRICDCFDALTSNRPYQQSISVNAALETLQRDAHCFEPHLLDLFCRLMTGPAMAQPDAVRVLRTAHTR
ncbi:MAG: HD domain-containing protein, partial [Gammaproteobacteria bacterium]|nr:HD domain-containing protein [Gammaproteobacteria bacterium]